MYCERISLIQDGRLSKQCRHPVCLHISCYIFMFLVVPAVVHTILHEPLVPQRREGPLSMGWQRRFKSTSATMSGGSSFDDGCIGKLSVFHLCALLRNLLMLGQDGMATRLETLLSYMKSACHYGQQRVTTHCDTCIWTWQLDLILCFRT